MFTETQTEAFEVKNQSPPFIPGFLPQHSRTSTPSLSRHSHCYQFSVYSSRSFFVNVRIYLWVY